MHDEAALEVELEQDPHEVEAVDPFIAALRDDLPADTTDTTDDTADPFLSALRR